MTERRSLPQKLAFVLGTALGLSACAQGASAPAAPKAMDASAAMPSTSAAGPERMDMEGQTAAFRKAEAELNLALGGEKEVQSKQLPPARSESRETPSGAAGRPGMKPGIKEEGAFRQPGDACGNACSALASMGRATEHLCGLAGESDHRCEDARERVRSATSRVQASCPACATN